MNEAKLYKQIEKLDPKKLDLEKWILVNYVKRKKCGTIEDLEGIIKKAKLDTSVLKKWQILGYLKRGISFTCGDTWGVGPSINMIKLSDKPTFWEGIFGFFYLFSRA